MPPHPRRDQRRPTMADVAAAAGVSTALVSIVMRGAPGAGEATRAKVLRVADDLGYVPDERARKLRQSRSGLIGVAFELLQPFHGDLVDALYAAAATRGYDLVLSGVTPRRDERAAVGALLRERCEAVLLLGSRMDPGGLAGLGARVPTQVIARAAGVPRIGSVRTDDVAGVGLAVDHLVALGHTTLIHVDGAGAPGAVDRATGFLDRVREHGIADRCAVVPGGPTDSDGVRAMTAILDRDGPGARPTGIVAFNDRCAIGALDVLLRRGVSVPGRMSVIGFDDSRFAGLAHVRLSTVGQDVDLMAARAVEQALAQIDGGTPADLVLPPRLIPRATTGPVGNR